MEASAKPNLNKFKKMRTTVWKRSLSNYRKSNPDTRLSRKKWQDRRQRNHDRIQETWLKKTRNKTTLWMRIPQILLLTRKIQGQTYKMRSPLEKKNQRREMSLRRNSLKKRPPKTNLKSGHRPPIKWSLIKKLKKQKSLGTRKNLKHRLCRRIKLPK